MVDGAVKYLPEATSYDRLTYQARSSPYARGAAEDTAAAIIGMLKRM
jgi:neutral ceramidase